MSDRVGCRGIDERGICILVIDDKMEPSTAKMTLKGSADSLNNCMWIRLLWPFQWGAPSFDAGEAFATMMATFVALVEVHFLTFVMLFIIIIIINAFYCLRQIASTAINSKGVNMGGNFKKAYNKSGKPSKYANTSNVSLDRAWGSRFEALSEDVERLLEEATVSKANGKQMKVSQGKKVSSI
ncbi:hypothetical protein ACOSQ3_022677 [Xanthoceras sorbifolium]